MSNKIQMNFELDHAVGYHYDKFPPLNLDYRSLVDELLAATDAIARYDQMLKAMHNSEILLAPMRNQEAVISSRMEGTISTMDEIMKYEADYGESDGASPNVRHEVIETFLYQRALRNAQRAMKDGYPLTQSLIKNIHQQLLSFGRGAAKAPGQFKNEQNYLADRKKNTILFIPISPEKLQDGLDALFDFIEKDSQPTLLKTALAHIEFEALHPFQDGNGRIGRMLITLMLWKAGSISAPHFYISSYFEENKDNYIDLMRGVSENNQWEEWCRFFLIAVHQQANRNLEIAEKIRILYEDLKVEFSDLLASKWSVSTLDFVFTNPVFRNSRFTSSSGIPAASASRFSRLLLERGYLRTIEEASGRRSAMYSFEPLMKLVRV